VENQRTTGTIVFLVNYDRLASPGSRKCEGGRNGERVRVRQGGAAQERQESR